MVSYKTKLALYVLGGLVAATAVAIVSLFVWHYNRTVDISPEHQGAEEAVFRALVAIRDGDTDGYMSLIHSASGDLQDKERMRYLSACKRLSYGLDRLSDSEIRDSITAAKDVRRSLVISMVCKFLDTDLPANWGAWEAYDPVVVRYRIYNTGLVSVVLKEDGEWKLAIAPLWMSDRVLKYRSFYEANIGHGEALAEEPFPLSAEEIRNVPGYGSWRKPSGHSDQ